MASSGDIPGNDQHAVAEGDGAVAVNVAQSGTATIYQNVVRLTDVQLEVIADRIAGKAGREQKSAGSRRCPYPGLEAFQLSDEAYFAGRNEEVAELAAAVDQHRITALIAASGAGKSSLVNAGLIPVLGARETEKWDIFSFRPGREPLKALSRAISGILEPNPSHDARLKVINQRVRSLRSGDVPLRDHVELLKAARQKEAAGRRHEVLFFIDQWEELYTQPDTMEDRAVLIRELLDITERGLARVMLTMRADFMGELLSDNTEFLHQLKPGICYLEKMTDITLRATIVKPAEKVGLTVPEDLISRLVADASTMTGEVEPGALPYLQFVLRRLWEQRERDTNSLTTQAYDGMKGLKGAIGAHASQTYRNLTAAEQRLAARIIPRLVNVSETSPDTSRRLPFADFDNDARALLRKLAEPDKRLIVLSSATDIPEESEILAEIAHEALLRDWKELTTWIADRREFFRLRNKLEADAKIWLENNRNPEFLIPAGKPLFDAQDLNAKAQNGDLSPDLANFVKLSVRKREADHAARREEQKRHVRRLTVRNKMLMGLAAILIFATSGAAYFWNRSVVAGNSASAALLLSRSEIAAGNADYFLALELAEESMAMRAGPGARSQSMQVVFDAASPELIGIVQPKRPLQSIAFTADGHLSVLGVDGGGLLIDVDSRETTAISAPVFNGSSSPWRHIATDEGEQAVISFHGTLYSDLQNGLGSDLPFKMGTNLSRADASIRSTGTGFVAAVNLGGDGAGYIADCSAPALTGCRSFEIRKPFEAITLSGDGKSLAVVSADIADGEAFTDWHGGQLVIAPLADLTGGGRFSAGEDVNAGDAVPSGILSIDWRGDLLAYGTDDGRLVLHEITEHAAKSREVIRQTNFRINSLAVQPAGRAVAYVCSISEMCLLQADGGETRFRHPFSEAIEIAFSMDGKRFAALHADGATTIWGTPLTEWPESGAAFSRSLASDKNVVSLTGNGLGQVAFARSDGRVSVVQNGKMSAERLLPTSETSSDRKKFQRGDVLVATGPEGRIGALTREGYLTTDLLNEPFVLARRLDRVRQIILLGSSKFAVADGHTASLIESGQIISQWPYEESWYAFGPALGAITSNPNTGELYISLEEGEIAAATPGNSELYGWSVYQDWAADPDGVENGTITDGDQSALSENQDDGDEVQPLPELKTVVPKQFIQDGPKLIKMMRPAQSLDIHPGGKWIVASRPDDRLLIHDIKSRGNPIELLLDNVETRKVLFSNSGKGLAALGSDGRIYVWAFDEKQSKAARQFVLDTARAGGTSGQAVDFVWEGNSRLLLSTADGHLLAISTDQNAWARARGRLTQDLEQLQAVR